MLFCPVACGSVLQPLFCQRACLGSPVRSNQFCCCCCCCGHCLTGQPAVCRALLPSLKPWLPSPCCLRVQVFANIAIIVTGEESPSIRDWATWVNILHFVDILCCCAILFPIVWSIKHLREASETDGKAARCLEKLVLFRQFYIMVVVFIYFTRIVVFLLRTNLEDTLYAWVADAAYELAYLAFYVWVGVKFRPNAENPYTKLRQEEIEIGRVV